MKLVIDIPDKDYEFIKDLQSLIIGSRGNCRNIQYNVINAIKNGTPYEERPKGKWIPVSERLPKEEGDYLLWGKIDENEEDEYSFIGSYDEGFEQFGIWHEQFDSRTLGSLGSEFYEYSKVDAWMPLPKPYIRGDV